MAPGWERWRVQLEAALAPVRDWMIRELAPERDNVVLELAAGPGDTGFAAAAHVGELGRLISTDFSPEMVEVARRRGDELGLHNVDYRVIDAERMELDTDSVDRVLCQNGYMLMADPAAALSETRRVLRPDGRLVLAVWGAPDHNPWVSIAARLLIERGHMAAPQPGSPGIFSMGSEQRTLGLLEAAGFSTVRTDQVAVRFAFADVDEYVLWATEVGGPLAPVIQKLGEEERETVKAHLQEAFVPFAAKGGYRLPGVCLNAVAS